MTSREAERSKNMFALGLMSWLYTRPTESTIDELREKFAKRPEIAEANIRAFQAGYAFGETTESFAVQYEVAPAKMAPGVYRNVTGNQALALGLVAASVKSGLPLFLGAYPITPASGILEELAGYKHFGVRTFQAEDEIAAVGAALGASFGGALGVSTSSGPGIVLKQETIGLAVTLELPLVILDIQRAGPSTGHADEAGAGRPAERDVRPQLGVAGAGGRGGDAGRLLRRDDRGLPDRAQVPDAGLHALGRVPRERLRAVADPRPGLDPGDSASSSRPRRTRTARSCRTCATRRRSRGRGRCRGRPGLEHRIGGLEKADVTGQRLLRPGQPRLHGPRPRAEGRRDRGGHPGARGRPRRGREAARARLGRDVRADHRGACGACGRRAARSRRRTCAT